MGPRKTAMPVRFRFRMGHWSDVQAYPPVMCQDGIACKGCWPWEQ